jgi:hypothetical protein
MEFNELKDEICKLSDKQLDLAIKISKINKEKIELMSKFSGNNNNIDLLSEYVNRLNSLEKDEYFINNIDVLYRKFCDKIFRRRCIFDEKFKSDHRSVLNRFSYINGKQLAIGRVGFGTKQLINSWKHDDEKNIYIQPFTLQDTIKLYSMYPITRNPNTLNPNMLKEYQEFYDLIVCTRFTNHTNALKEIGFNKPIELFSIDELPLEIMKQYDSNNIHGIYNDIEFANIKLKACDIISVDCYRGDIGFKSSTKGTHVHDISLRINPKTSGNYIDPNIYRLPEQVFDALESIISNLESIRDNNKKVYDKILEKFGHKFLVGVL